MLEHKPEMINFSKWGIFLPSKYQAAIICQQFYDFPGAFQLLENCNFVENE
jgi:ATP-dependent Lhr-like helicase